MYYSARYMSARIAAVVSTIVSVVLFSVQTNVWRSLAGPGARPLLDDKLVTMDGDITSYKHNNNGVQYIYMHIDKWLPLITMLKCH